MSENTPYFLTQTINKIFTNNQKALTTATQFKGKKGSVSAKELELALTVLLVELASSDQNFDMPEYNAICISLKRLFGATREEVSALVNQATVVLRNLRGTSQFAILLRDNLSLDQRKVVLQVIDEVIDADGVKDGFEIYLREKFVNLLGLGERARTDS